jgi:hypothetical protein
VVSASSNFGKGAIVTALFTSPVLDDLAVGHGLAAVTLSLGANVRLSYIASYGGVMEYLIATADTFRVSCAMSSNGHPYPRCATTDATGAAIVARRCVEISLQRVSETGTMDDIWDIASLYCLMYGSAPAVGETPAILIRFASGDLGPRPRSSPVDKTIGLRLFCEKGMIWETAFHLFFSNISIRLFCCENVMSVV